MLLTIMMMVVMTLVIDDDISDNSYSMYKDRDEKSENSDGKTV